MASGIDPNNPLQEELLERLDDLSDEEVAALRGLPPVAISGLKKVLREVAFIFDQGAPQEGAGGPPMPSPGGGGMQMAGAPAVPRSPLSQI